MERITPGYVGATELREMLRIHFDGQPVKVNSLAGPWLDWTYVGDIAEGIKRIWEAPALQHDVYTNTLQPTPFNRRRARGIRAVSARLPLRGGRARSGELHRLRQRAGRGPVECPHAGRAWLDPADIIRRRHASIPRLDSAARTAVKEHRVTERNEYLLAHLTPRDLEEREIDTAILPIGATEYHGNHLPYSTDTIMAEGLSLRLARELEAAVVLPPLDYGMSLHLMAWPWTVSLRPETLHAVVIDIAESLLGSRHHQIAGRLHARRQPGAGRECRPRDQRPARDGGRAAARLARHGPVAIGRFPRDR